MIRPAWFIAEGVFRSVNAPPTPRLKRAVSAKAKLGRWQEAQLMVRSEERIGSKNSLSPSSAFVFGSSALNTGRKLSTAPPSAATSNSPDAFIAVAGSIFPN